MPHGAPGLRCGDAQGRRLRRGKTLPSTPQPGHAPGRDGSNDTRVPLGVRTSTVALKCEVRRSLGAGNLEAKPTAEKPGCGVPLGFPPVRQVPRTFEIGQADQFLECAGHGYPSANYTTSLRGRRSCASCRSNSTGGPCQLKGGAIGLWRLAHTPTRRRGRLYVWNEGRALRGATE
jgi:hypothetical protein